MSSESAFTVAVVTSDSPVELSFQEFDLGPEGNPDDAFDTAHTPRTLEYPFDPDEADQVLHAAGYELCTGWQWAGTGWGAVVQPKAAPAEGWGVIRPGDRKAHYYRNTMALCRRVGFYLGPLDPDTGPGPDDHKECRRILDRESR